MSHEYFVTNQIFRQLMTAGTEWHKHAENNNIFFSGVFTGPLFPLTSQTQ